HPDTGTWSPTGSLHHRRYGHVAAPLPGGRVLVAGGARGNASAMTYAEIYHPKTGRWTQTAPMHDPRTDATATVLPDGRVLVAGGRTGYGDRPTLSSAELYDPASGTWSFTGNMNMARRSYVASILPDRTVLVAGGATDQNGHITDTAEIYHPDTGAWSFTDPM